MADRDDQRFLPASKLAEMGFCERRILLARKLGKRETPGDVRAKARGNEEHARFHDQVRAMHNDRAPARDPRCFIATAVWGGQDPRTEDLRAWRDEVLAATTVGRLLIRTYYRLSPRVAAAIDRWPRLRGVAGVILEVIRRVVSRR